MYTANFNKYHYCTKGSFRQSHVMDIFSTLSRFSFHSYVFTLPQLWYGTLELYFNLYIYSCSVTISTLTLDMSSDWNPTYSTYLITVK